VAVSLAFFGLVVEDIPRSLEFYRRLGLDIPAAADQEQHVEHMLPGGAKIAWDSADTIKSFDAEWTAPTGGHRIALAFTCSSPAEVEALFDELGGFGYGQYKKPWDAFWGQRYAIVLDPDGNHIELAAPLA
jgi:catechol 2,3-dioxygenase-like lactoylglutathione lyase family enzyme